MNPLEVALLTAREHSKHLTYVFLILVVIIVVVVVAAYGYKRHKKNKSKLPSEITLQRSTSYDIVSNSTGQAI